LFAYINTLFVPVFYFEVKETINRCMLKVLAQWMGKKTVPFWIQIS